MPDDHGADPDQTVAECGERPPLVLAGLCISRAPIGADWDPAQAFVFGAQSECYLNF